MELCERLLERGVFAQGIRPPTVPEGSSRLRFTVMSTHGAEELREAAKQVGAAAREVGLAPRPAAAPVASSPAPMAARGIFVTGTGTEVGKTVVAAAIARTLAAEGRRVAVFKPCVTGLEEPGATSRTDRSLAAGRAAGSRADRRRDRPLPLRPARLPAPGGGAGRRGDRPGAAARRGPRRRRGRRRIVCEGVGGLLVPLSPAYLVRDLAADLGYPLVVVAPPGLGTINHTLLTIESARAAGLEVAAVVLTPWPAEPTAIERSNRETIAALGDARVLTLPSSTSPTPTPGPDLAPDAR